jgi:transcriptional regulator with XRE-family HTH domain
MDEQHERLAALGAFIRAQRQLADLSLRQMAELARISNPYLSQLERGLHEPSMRVLQSIAEALNLSAETLLEHAGVIVNDGHDHGPADTEASIRQDPLLTDEQKQALLMIYRSYVHGRGPAPDGTAPTNGAIPADGAA